MVTRNFFSRSRSASSNHIARCAIAFAIAAVLAAMPVAGCASSSPSASSATASAQQAQSIDVTVTVAGEQGANSLDESVALSLPAGETALAAIKDSGLSVTAESSPYGEYVTSIEGISAGGSSGWTYSVNGEQPMEAAGSYVLADGDTVEWTFVMM